MSRQEINIQIAKKILDFCKHPESKDLRFGQILADLHITEYNYDKEGILTFPIDIYNESSSVTLKRMKEKQS